MSKEVKGFITIPLLYKFQNDPRTLFMDLVAKHGRCFALRGLRKNLHFFSDPKFVEHVYCSNSSNYERTPQAIFDPIDNPKGSLNRDDISARWLKCKKNILSSQFSESAMKKYVNTMVEGTGAHLQDWEKFVGKESVSVYSPIQHLSIRNMQKTLLGNIDFDVDHFISTIDEAINLLIKHEYSLTKLPWILPTRTAKRTKFITDEIIGIHDHIIDLCLQPQVDMTVFKEIQKTFDEEYRLDEDPEDLRTFLRTVAIVYSVASFNSIALSVPVCLAYLSLNPSVANQVREEVQRVIGTGKITPENVDALSFTRNTFLESLRYSGGIFPWLVRQAKEDDDIDGYKVNKGDKILVSVPYLCHLSEYWENPEGFDPSRFNRIDISDESYRGVNLVFGAGPTSCLGRHFATIQSTIILAMALQKFRFDLIPHQKWNPDRPSEILLSVHRI